MNTDRHGAVDAATTFFERAVLQRKLQTSNFKHQRNSKHQYPSSKEAPSTKLQKVGTESRANRIIPRFKSLAEEQGVA
jgi:hypothetical protein